MGIRFSIFVIHNYESIVSGEAIPSAEIVENLSAVDAPSRTPLGELSELTAP